jgi:hypothetical protein
MAMLHKESRKVIVVLASLICGLYLCSCSTIKESFCTVLPKEPRKAFWCPRSQGDYLLLHWCVFIARDSCISFKYPTFYSLSVFLSISLSFYLFSYYFCPFHSIHPFSEDFTIRTPRFFSGHLDFFVLQDAMDWQKKI